MGKNKSKVIALVSMSLDGFVNKVPEMKIEIEKVTPFKCEYTVTRKDLSAETITLDAKTYFVHDICHYVVEKYFGFSKGFWGMLSSGHSFDELLGKENELTTQLRFVEQVVGPVQSAFSGHIPIADFEQFISHLNFQISENDLNNCLSEIKTLIADWEQLSIGQYLLLKWDYQQ